MSETKIFHKFIVVGQDYPNLSLKLHSICKNNAFFLSLVHNFFLLIEKITIDCSLNIRAYNYLQIFTNFIYNFNDLTRREIVQNFITKKFKTYF